MAFTEEEINDFRVEAEELLDSAEQALLELDKGADFKTHYDSIFRAFHSIKGAAGMMEMFDVQAHMHQLENTLTDQKKNPVLAKPYIDLFLRGSDGARSLLNGKVIDFDYSAREDASSAPAPAPSPQSAEIQQPVSTGSSHESQAPFQTRVPEGATVTPIAKTTKVPRGRVLVVDDEPDLVTIISNILKKTGFEVFGTSSSVEALDLIEKYNPDAVLTDLMMPIVSGMDILQALRAKHPDLPVVFITGYVSKEFLLEAIESGVFGIVEKPFDSGKVFEICNNAVQKFRTLKLLNSSVNLIMYQFHDLDEYLKTQGKDDIRKVINHELEIIIQGRRHLPRN